MHLFFDTVWKLHIGEIPEKPKERDYIDMSMDLPDNSYYNDLQSYNEAIAAIKHNALTVGNPDIIDEVIRVNKNWINGHPMPGEFYLWPGGYENGWTTVPAVVKSKEFCSTGDTYTTGVTSIKVAILTLPEEKTLEEMDNDCANAAKKLIQSAKSINLKFVPEKKNTMENSIEEIALALTIENFNTSDPQTNPYYYGCLAGLKYSKTSSGSVAAPKEEKDFEALKWKVGTIMAEQFLKFNDGKFTATIELNPATHALTEYLQSELASLRQQLTEHKAINSLLAGDEPEVALANEVFQLRQQLKEREEALKELLPMAEWKLQSTSDYLANFSETIETEPEKYNECDRLKAIIERARKLINP